MKLSKEFDHRWEKIRKICVKIYAGLLKEFHDSKFDKKSIFVTDSENWIHTLRMI